MNSETENIKSNTKNRVPSRSEVERSWRVKGTLSVSEHGRVSLRLNSTNSDVGLVITSSIKPEYTREHRQPTSLGFSLYSS